MEVQTGNMVLLAGNKAKYPEQTNYTMVVKGNCQ